MGTKLDFPSSPKPTKKFLPLTPKMDHKNSLEIPTNYHNLPLTESTGEPWELLTQSRTKEVADHAGPSLLFHPLNLTTTSPLENSSPLLSNNLLTATPDAMDAMVDGKNTVWNTPKPTHFP